MALGVKSSVFCCFIDGFVIILHGKLYKFHIMMKRLLFISLLAASSVSALADDLRSTAVSEAGKHEKVRAEVSADADSVHWKFPCKVGLNFGQTAYERWAEGGDNSISFSAFADLQANYKSGKKMWNNELYGEYGLMFSDSYDRYKWRKNLDKLTFTSNYGYRSMFKSWYYSALLDFKSQLASGYEYTFDDSLGTQKNPTSGIFSPAYLIGSLGMEYIPNKYVSVYISPVAGRFTFCEDYRFREKYGMEQNSDGSFKWHKEEFGAYLRVINDFDVMENVHLASKLDFFTPYTEDFGNVIVNWDLLLTLKVNKYINASIRTQMKYDDNISHTYKTPVKNNGRVVRSDDANLSQIGNGPVRVESDKSIHYDRGARLQWMDAINVGISYSF